MPYCIYCGRQVEDVHSFCVWCGRPTAGEPPVRAPASGDIAQPIPAAAPVQPVPAATPLLRPYRPVVAIAGIAVVLLSSFLPWLSIGFLSVSASISAWDVPFLPLLTGRATATGFPTGVVLLVVVVSALPFLTGRPLPTVASVVLGAVPVLTAALTIKTALRSTPHLGIGFGVYLAFAGGLLVAYESVRSRRWLRTRQ
jgi:hypothetical protein